VKDQSTYGDPPSLRLLRDTNSVRQHQRTTTGNNWYEITCSNNSLVGHYGPPLTRLLFEEVISYGVEIYSWLCSGNLMIGRRVL